MLANLLPGIREIRAPLAAGYLWLSLIWLMWARNLPLKADATGLLADLYTLAGAVGLPAMSVAISFVAYLIGIPSLSRSMWFAFVVPLPPHYARPRSSSSLRDLLFDLNIGNPSRFEYRGRGVQVWSRLSGGRSPGVSPIWAPLLRFGSSWRWITLLIMRGAWPLQRWNYLTHPKLANRQDAIPVTEETLNKVNLVVGVIHREIALTPARLLGTEIEVYNAYDRAKAEAEFRIGVTAPLLGLAIGAGWTVSLVAGLTMLAGSALLFTSGIRRLDEADHLLLEALRAREDRIGQGARTFLKEYGETLYEERQQSVRPPSSSGTEETV
ncbi:hypothetical protein AB0J28_33600 [Streptosporangium canum]|uniref:hypothetical protein n=1 Tax=Streptosporangium canum TaxID=324952 RepID=UPI003430574E